MRRASILLVLFGLGCGPSLKELLPQKHYREAVCEAHDGSEGDRGEVLRALAADADVSLHVYAMTTDELRSLLGDATDSIGSRATFARVRVQTNALPVDGLDVVAAVASEGAMAEPVTWDSLAKVTNEPLPPHRIAKSYATVGNAVAVLTLGLSLLFGVGGDSRNVEVDAPHSDYLKMAPRATALHDAFGRAGCSGVSSSGATAGKSCDGYFIIDATKSAPVRLEVAVRYMALREGGRIDDPPRYAEKKRCELTSKSVVPLGRANGLAGTVKAVFGQGPRRLADVAK